MRVGVSLRTVTALTLMACASGMALSPPAPQAQQPRVYTNDDLAVPVSTLPDSSENSSAAPDESGAQADPKGAPYAPTAMETVDRMLETAGVTANDVVYDLGSGDGRIVLRAAQRFGANAVGVEIEPALVKASQDRARELKLDKLAKFVEGDLLKADMKPATVVTLYLMLEMNARLRPLLEKQLRPGTRVVTNRFPVPEWIPISEESIHLGSTSQPIYLYTVPDSFPKRVPQ